jgi:DNA polymerase-3 subunit gamma/tau
MTYEVLARKWRPHVFRDVVGQEHITQTLVNAIKSGRLAHAYLFSGARGVGKTSVARIFAKAINCTDGEPGTPCNKCRSCLEITGGSSVDVQEIDGASNRGIDEIRELRENIKYLPASSKFRIYIIDEVHMLTREAFNALLKTLEEPPAHVKFFFATTEPHKVPMTILSRCQRFDFKRIPSVKIVQQLEAIAESEGIEIPKSGLALIAREAEGSLRDAESILDQVISCTGLRVEDKDIIDILGIIDRDLIFETSLAIIEGRADRCMEIVDTVYNYGHDVKEFYRILMDQFRNLLLSMILPQSDLFDLTDGDRQEIEHQAKVAGAEKLHQALSLLLAREETLRYTSHPRLVLEMILISLCRLGERLSFDQIFSKIESLEKRLLGLAPADGALSVHQLAEAGIRWENQDQRQDPMTRAAEDSPEKAWENLRDHIASKNPSMANVLREWSLVSLTEDTLEISRGTSSFSASYLDETQRTERLAGYCREFFDREMEIKIVGDKPRPFRETRPPRNREPNADRTKETGFPHPVQDILQLFQGEIKEEVLLGQNHTKDPV